MTIKSILYPFGDKYSFLNNKWWHRLLKVLFSFMLLLIPLFFIGSLINNTPIFPILWSSVTFGVGESYNIRERLSIMGGDIVLRGKQLSDIRKTYPEFSSLDDKVLGELGYDIANGATLDEIIEAYPELKVKETEIQNKRNIKERSLMILVNNTLYYIMNTVAYIIITFIIYIFIRIFYYKGVIYIIYGDSINNK